LSLAYLGFVLVAVVLPGLGIQRWARVRPDLALVLPLGAAQAALAYGLSLVSGHPVFFPALVALSAAGLLRRGERPEPPGSPLALLGAFTALVVLLAFTQYRGNRPGPGGEFRLDPMGDQPLHAGITWELAHPWPPQVPGLAGVPLSYHYGADLVRAAAVSWAGVTPYAPLNREEPTLWALALMLTVAALVRRLGGGPLAIALAPFTVLLTDLSFVCALFPGVRWWSDVFRGNVLISLAFTNPVVPALALALGSLLALSRYEEGKGRGWLLLALVQAVAVPWFKVFLGVQLVLGLLLAALVTVYRARLVAPGGANREAMLPAAGALALGVAAAASSLPLLLGRSGERVEVAVAPLRMVRESLVHLDLGDGGLLRLAFLALPWLVVSFGLRAFGLRRAWRALTVGGPALAAAGALALSGWPLGLLFQAAARDIEGRELPSATIYFLEQSGVVLWAFAAVALGAWAAERRRPVLALLLVALLGVPPTIEFAVRKAGVDLDPVPAPFVRAVEAMARDGRRGDVVLQRPGPRFPPLPVVLTGQRVVYERFTPYLTQFAPGPELRRRHELLFRFFQTRDREEARGIAERLGARYVCLYGSERLRFDPAGWLVPVHEEDAARAYRVVVSDSPGR